MPKYRLKKEHYLQAKKPGAKPGDKDPWAKEPQLHEAGAVVDWDGKPSLHMEPVDKEAREQVEARHAEFKEKRQQAQAGRSMSGWTPAFQANMEHIITSEAPADGEVQAGQRKRKAA